MIGMFPQIFAFRIKMLNGDLCAGLIFHTKISEGLLVELRGVTMHVACSGPLTSRRALVCISYVL